jgi:hypothetical protein
MDYDSASNMKGVPGIEYATYSTDQTSTSIDTSLYNYKALTLALEIGAGGITFTGTNRVDFVVTHSDDDSNYVAVTDDDVVIPYSTTLTVALMGATPATGVVKALIAAHASADVSYIGYRGKKRYVKFKFDFGGTHSSGTPMGFHWCFDHPMSAPNWQTSVTGDVI